MISNGASFANGSSMDLGSGESYRSSGGEARDGTRPALLFPVLVFRL